MEHPLYVPSADTRASLEAAQHLQQLRQIVGTLHSQFSWQQKWEQLLLLDGRFREMDGTRGGLAEGPSSFDDDSRAGREILLDPIPLWPADRWPASEEYVARKIRRHGNAGLRCLVYASRTEMPLWQSVARRASHVFDVIQGRGTRSAVTLPPHVLANRALMLFKRWQRRAAQDPTVLPVARSLYARLLDAPPVDAWQGYYSMMHGSIWRLRNFLREAVSADQPAALLVPFTLEPYALTLLAAPDYPTNLLLANVFLESSLGLDRMQVNGDALTSRVRASSPPRESRVQQRGSEPSRTSRPAHPSTAPLPL